MFNIGPTEILIILVVGLAVFGRQFPQVARDLGRKFARFRQSLQEAQSTRQKEMDAASGEVKRELDSAANSIKAELPDPTSLTSPDQAPDQKAEPAGDVAPKGFCAPKTLETVADSAASSEEAEGAIGEGAAAAAAAAAVPAGPDVVKAQATSKTPSRTGPPEAGGQDTQASAGG